MNVVDSSGLFEYLSGGPNAAFVSEPLDVGFPFDLHRCNVAVLCVQGRVVVITSPRLFDEVPGSVVGLRLVNAHVRLVNAREGQMGRLSSART